MKILSSWSSKFFGIFASCVFSYSFLISSSSFAEVIRRAAFDLGSGSYKLKIADVDTNLQVIVQYISIPESKDQVKILAAEEIARSADKVLGPDFQKNAVAALKSLKETAASLGAKEFIGVATGAYRSASNGEKFMADLSKETGIALSIVDARRESWIGYMSALAKSGISNASNIVVWDVGGSSMQFAYLDTDKKFQFYSSPLASVSFKNSIVKNIIKADPQLVLSPNPLSSEQVKESLNLLNDDLSQFPEPVRNISKNRKQEILGIGGVHNFSIGKNIKLNAENTYDLLTIKDLIQKRVAQKLDDDGLRKQTGTKYPETDVSNLLLISGVMEKLNISKVKIVDANLCDGLLVTGASLDPK